VITKLLSTSAHNSPESAHVIGDWPYGRKLRCEKHIWIETRKNFGQRVCYRTTNPKRLGTFNAPKNGGYNAFTIFGEDSQGMLVIEGLEGHSSPETFARVRALPLDEKQLSRLNGLEIYACKYNARAWENQPALNIAPFSNTSIVI